jgi:hypothetical protein
MNKKRSALLRVTAFLLVLVFVCPVNANAVESRASNYLDSYGAYIYPAGWYKVQVWFDISGVATMDEIGTLSIRLYESTDNENWTWVTTFNYSDYPDMLAYDDYHHAGHVEYQGAIGKYYKAYVCVWAGKDGEGDTRYFWTSPVKATLFAG